MRNKLYICFIKMFVCLQTQCVIHLSFLQMSPEAHGSLPMTLVKLSHSPVLKGRSKRVRLRSNATLAFPGHRNQKKPGVAQVQN